MVTDLTPDLIKALYGRGCTFLYAPHQFQFDNPLWIPMIVPLDECDWIDPDSDAILTIKEAFNIPFENFHNHKVIMPQ